MRMRPGLKTSCSALEITLPLHSWKHLFRVPKHDGREHTMQLLHQSEKGKGACPGDPNPIAARWFLL